MYYPESHSECLLQNRGTEPTANASRFYNSSVKLLLLSARTTLFATILACIVISARRKYFRPIDVRRHFVHETVQAGVLELIPQIF